MTRIDLLRSFLDSTRLGLEIGASHTPTCPKAAGFNVEILDHLDQAGLREKYREHPIDISMIEHVDHVWNGEPFATLTQKPKGYGWVLASHVIEHTPDLIDFLNDCDSVLGDDGVLVLAVPDKRYCFDHFRERSSLAGVIDAHIAKRKIHSQGTAAEVYLNLCSSSGNWMSDPAKLSIWGSRDLALSMMASAKSGEYTDMHAWSFTPTNFRLILSDLFDLGLTEMREVAFFENGGYEFFFALGRRGNGPGIERIDLARRSQQEISTQYFQPTVLENNCTNARDVTNSAHRLGD